MPFMPDDWFRPKDGYVIDGEQLDRIRQLSYPPHHLIGHYIPYEPAYEQGEHVSLSIPDPEASAMHTDLQHSHQLPELIQEEEDTTVEAEATETPYQSHFTSFPSFSSAAVDQTQSAEPEVIYALADSPIKNTFHNPGLSIQIPTQSVTTAVDYNLPPLTKYMVKRLPETLESPVSPVTSESGTTDECITAGVDIIDIQDTLSMSSANFGSDDPDEDEVQLDIPRLSPIIRQRRNRQQRGPSFTQRISRTISGVFQMRSRSRSPERDDQEGPCYREREWGIGESMYKTRMEREREEPEVRRERGINF